MLWDASAINGFSLQASDGVFGNVSDLLFDDVHWSLRWLVVDTQMWPFGRTVDFPLSRVGTPNFAGRSFQTNDTLGALGASLSPDEHSLRRSDSHLLSVATLIGYTLAAMDGDIGHVENLLVDDQDLTIKFVTVHTAEWWPGVKVLIAPASISQIDAKDRRLVLTVDCATVRAGPVFDASATIDGVQEAKFLTYFGIRWTDS